MSNLEFNINVGGNIFNSIKELKVSFSEVNSQINMIGDNMAQSVNLVNKSISNIEIGAWLDILNEVENSFREILQTGVDFEQSIADL